MLQTVCVRQRLARILLLGLFAMQASSGVALAHTVGENYIFVNVRESGLDGRVEIHFDDLQDKLGVDPARGGGDPVAAVRANAPRVQEYIAAHFSIGPVGGAPYALEFTSTEVLSLAQGSFAQYHFRVAAADIPDTLAIRHDMLYEEDRFHRGLLLVEYNAKTNRNYGEEYVAMVFAPATVEQTLDLINVPGLLRAREMIWQGILHIWIGLDHVLFLVALMLPTVLVLRNAAYMPVPGFGRALLNLTKIITVFTIAHSITLLLAAMGLLDVPSRLVESVIALSIILVALNNITGKVREGSLLVILVLGLFHGLGFASVMGHLPFRMETLLKTVVGFNIGVELGQLAIVAALFPALFYLRRLSIYTPVVLKGGSAVLILISGAWFFQRALGLD